MPRFLPACRLVLVMQQIRTFFIAANVRKDKRGIGEIRMALPLPLTEYMTDAAQRSLLFWDVMRQRGNQYREHLAETAPHVLDYEVELVVDGRTLDRPVNYG